MCRELPFLAGSLRPTFRGIDLGLTLGEVDPLAELLGWLVAGTRVRLREQLERDLGGGTSSEQCQGCGRIWPPGLSAETGGRRGENPPGGANLAAGRKMGSFPRRQPYLGRCLGDTSEEAGQLPRTEPGGSMELYPHLGDPQSRER